MCGRGACRRGNRCRWHFEATGEPVCLRNLDDEQREVFDQLLRTARAAQSFLGSNSEKYQTPDGPKRALDDIAIDIARSTPRRWNRPRWDAARREREKRLPPAR
jgi:hypothetical protein